MSWWAKLKERANVAPAAMGSSKMGTGSSDINGSMLLESIASLTPSQLDVAIMNMLNITQGDNYMNRICNGESGTAHAPYVKTIAKRHNSQLPVTKSKLKILSCMFC